VNFFIGTGVLIGLMVLSIPIGFALGIAGVASLAMTVPPGSIASLMTNVVHSTVSNSAFLTIPMFVLMAEFLSCGGVAEDLLLACNRLLRRVRGGLAMACILAGVVHAAATGSSAASAASLARASFPAMMKAGYDSSFAAGTIAIAGTLAIMIPPSVAFVLYGLMTETSIGKLFLAGIVPGVLTALGYILTISFMLWWRPELGPNPKKEAEVAAATQQASERGRTWPMVLLIVVILGGLYGGVATPTEISAIGALGALLISMSSGRITRSNFAEAVGATLRITTMIIAIVYGAHLFGYFISFSKVTDAMLAWIASSGLSPISAVILIVIVYLVLGTFMDQAAIIILTAPITTPLVVGLGYDPVWWGVLMIKTAEVGLVSPPLGLVTFVVASSTKTDIRSNFIGVAPYVIAELILLALLIAFPEITLWLTR
jgi:C4-dicarboxylate transporter, DctM subunit